MVLVFVIVLIVFHTFSLYTIDNAHFYRANFFWGEPRIALDWFSTIDMSCGAGHSHHAQAGNGKRTELLSVYGLHAIPALAENLYLDPTDKLDAILIHLNELPHRKHFGTLAFNGKFSTWECTINWYQNLINGFFFQTYLPIRQLTISDISFTDLSPDDTINPNKNSLEWQAFLQNMNAIFRKRQLTIEKSSRMGIGDLSLLGGWACTTFDTCVLDYVDVAAKIGVLFPTGKTQNLQNPFELPLGYNGHYGMPVKFDVAFGAYEWITIGAHVGALFLFDRTTLFRIKTAEAQQGLIFLPIEKVKIESGTLWDMAAYIKADHFCKGLSLLLGYSYNKKDPNEMKETDHRFDVTIANHDQRLKGWSMHVFNLIVEYDFSKFHNDIGPRVGLWYNHVLAGKRIINTNMLSGALGFDIEWYF